MSDHLLRQTRFNLFSPSDDDSASRPLPYVIKKGSPEHENFCTHLAAAVALSDDTNALSKCLKVPFSAMHRWKNGVVPKPQSFARLADLLGISESALYDPPSEQLLEALRTKMGPLKERIDRRLAAYTMFRKMDKPVITMTSSAVRRRPSKRRPAESSSAPLQSAGSAAEKSVTPRPIALGTVLASVPVAMTDAVPQPNKVTTIPAGDRNRRQAE